MSLNKESDTSRRTKNWVYQNGLSNAIWSEFLSRMPLEIIGQGQIQQISRLNIGKTVRDRQKVSI